MIRDRTIDWLRQVRRIPAGAFINSQVTGASVILNGLGTGAPQLLEVSSFAYAGISIGAADDDFACLDLVHPCQWDPEEEIGVRVLWTTNGAVATTDSVTFTVTYDQADPGEALGDATTALDTAIAAQSPTATTLLFRQTARGIINPNTFDYASRAGALAWKVDVTDLTDFSADEVVFLGLEIDFMPLLCANAEENLDVFSSRAASA